MTPKSTEAYSGQRGKEKRQLFGRFRLRAIENFYRQKFFTLFDLQCFKCGAKERQSKEIGKPPVLCIDHHVPMALGGHLVPGNLVALCRDCNNKKLDSPPEEFYSPIELKKLQPILLQQHEIFAFTFDLEAWDNDREDYLIGLGMDKCLVQELLFNPDHPDYIAPVNTPGVSVTIDLASIFAAKGI